MRPQWVLLFFCMGGLLLLAACSAGPAPTGVATSTPTSGLAPTLAVGPGTPTPVPTPTALPPQPTNKPPIKGAAARDFSVKGLDGKTVTLGQFNGKPLYLVFCVTWAEACQKFYPVLQSVYEKRSPDIQVLVIDFGEQQSVVKDYMAFRKLTLPTALDAEQRVSAGYGVFAVPTNFFIDKDGVVQHYEVTALSEDEIGNFLKTVQ